LRHFQRSPLTKAQNTTLVAIIKFLLKITNF
jgi:hypothetical protein